METYDVAIIGAGPAGGSAGLHAAKAGLKTVILEEHQTIGEPVHCGECLSEISEIRTGIKFPKEAISLPVNGVRVVFPDGSDRFVTEKGFVLEKHTFEQWLAGEAQNAGAELSLGSRATALERQDGTWKIATSKGEIRAKLILDASGAAGVANRLLNLNPRFKVTTGIQYELTGIPHTGYLDFYLWPRLAPGGYLWMIPKCDTRANVGLVTHDITKAKVYLDQFVKEMGWEAKPKIKTFGGPIPSSGPVEKTFADGIMLIGDAAGFTSPLFEGGTQLGLVSGKLAVQVAKEGLNANRTDGAFLQKYERLWKAEFPPYGKIVRGKDSLYAFSDPELDRIARLFPKEMGGMSPLQKLRIGISLLTKNRDLRKKHAMRVFGAFKYSRAKSYGW